MDEAEGYLWPRWIFLRALGLIFFSAFYALAFQIHGLIGERGILPAGLYLDRISNLFGPLARVLDHWRESRTINARLGAPNMSQMCTY